MMRDAQAAVDAVETALKGQDRPAAIRLALRALDAGHRHPMLLNLRAYWHEAQNRLGLALDDLRAAVVLAPDDPAILNAYGLILARSDRPAEAVAVFRRVTTMKPDFGPAWFSLGHAAEHINDLTTARAAYECAATKTPSFPLPAAHLAQAAAHRGDWIEARRWGERALALDPSLTLAGRAIATADIATRDFPAAEARLDAQLAQPGCDWNDAYFAHSLKGDVRHAQGLYAEAFAEYVAGGAIARAAAAPRFDGGRSALGVVDWLTRTFRDSAPWPAVAGREATGGGALSHTFLLGFPRSGTTLVEQAFAARPDVATLEEQEALVDAARQFMSGPSGLAPLGALSDAEREDWRARYWRRVEAFGVNVSGRHFIDKLPFNTLKLPLISRLFPEATVLFALRDPRDVVLSCLRQRFRVGAYTYDLLTPSSAARFYAATMTLAALFVEKLPLRIHYVRHEAVVDDFEGELRTGCDLMGLGWDERMHDFATRAVTRPAATPSAVQLKRGLNRDGIGQWRRYRDQLEPVLPILRPWVEGYGYPAT